MLTTLAVVGLAFSLDLLVGEPPNRLHPVAWFGRLVAPLDRGGEWGPPGRRRRLGIPVALLLPLVPAAVAGWLVLAAATVHPVLGAVVAAFVLFSATSLRMLLDLTRDVVDSSATDPEGAREAVRGLVGRDASTLSPAAVRSAAVESAGENLADGLVGPLLPFVLLAPVSLPAAAAAAGWVKGVNTLDSVLGYRSKPIGTASARLDDLVMWLPARLAAVCLALAARDLLSLWRARRWARVPASPNSGWPMATLACGLGVRLEKRGEYALNPDAPLPTVEDGRRAVSVVGVAGALAIGLVALAAVYATPLLESLPVHFEGLPSGVSG